MPIYIKLIVGIVAFLHFYFLWFEMFAWTTKGPKVFKKTPKELFPMTKPMAANQGLYNGFLAAGLAWSLLISNVEWQYNIATFFLICVAVAGIYGAYSVSKRIFYIQAIPALIGLLFILLNK